MIPGSAANNPIERSTNGQDAFASLDNASFRSEKFINEHSDLSVALSVLLGREPLLFGEPVHTKFFNGIDRAGARETQLLPYIDYIDTNAGRKLAVGIFVAGQSAENRELHIKALVAGSDPVAAMRSMWIVGALELVSAVDLDMIASAAHAGSRQEFFERYCTTSLEVSTQKIDAIFSRPLFGVEELLYDMALNANIRPARTPLLSAALNGLLWTDRDNSLPSRVQTLIDELPGVRNPVGKSAELLSRLSGSTRVPFVESLKGAFGLFSRVRPETAMEDVLKKEFTELILDLRVQHERLLHMGLIELCEDDRAGGTASEQIIASELGLELRKVDRFMRAICAAESIGNNLDLPRAVHLLAELENAFISAMIVAEDLKKEASCGPKISKNNEALLREHVPTSLQGLYASFNRSRREFLPGRYSNVPALSAAEGMAVR